MARTAWTRPWPLGRRAAISTKQPGMMHCPSISGLLVQGIGIPQATSIASPRRPERVPRRPTSSYRVLRASSLLVACATHRGARMSDDYLPSIASGICLSLGSSSCHESNRGEASSLAHSTPLLRSPDWFEHLTRVTWSAACAPYRQ